MTKWQNSHCYQWQMVSIFYAQKLTGIVQTYVHKLQKDGIAWYTEIAIVQKLKQTPDPSRPDEVLVKKVEWKSLKPPVADLVDVNNAEIALLNKKIAPFDKEIAAYQAELARL